MTPLPMSTALFYERSKSSVGTLMSRADRLQIEVSTEKKLQAPSDGTVAYQRLQRIARDTTDDKVYGANLDTAASLLGQADSTLDTMADEIQRASELAVRAATATMTAVDRKAIGVELAGIVKSLVKLGNTADTRGLPLFGDAAGAAAVVDNGDGSFVLAQTTTTPIPVAVDQAVQTGEPASQVFALPGNRDVLTMLSKYATMLQTGIVVPDVPPAPNDPAPTPEQLAAAFQTALGTAITDLTGANDQVAAVRSSLGARAARVEIAQAQATAIGTDREIERSALEDTDVPAAIADLQKTMTILSATQASFAKLAQLSLFDYLR